MLFLMMESGDKTEDPTPHRLREARRKGQVFKSMEVNAASSILGIMLLFLLVSPWVYSSFAGLFNTFLGEMLASAPQRTDFMPVLREAILLFLRLSGPVLVAAVGLGLVANLSQVGFLVTASPMIFQLNRINPLEGVKRILSRRAAFELVKALLKLAIVGTVTYFFVKGRLPEMLVLFNQEPYVSARFFWNTFVQLGLRVGAVFTGLAAVDYLFQRAEFQRSMKMSRKEIKEEHKHLEGDPLVRTRIREKQRQLARQRMLQEVPTADVVVTNPTSLAVALRYREGRDNAPVVVAKGAAVLARRIREIALENQVMIVENPPVAQMLWKKVEIGDEVPVEMYQAVAEILAMVYRIRRKKRY